MRHNGGIHNSIYAKPQLVDGESIIFCMRALLELHKTTGAAEDLAAARRAAEMVVTWICLWDVPLPAESTLARRGFRSTGWMACDAPGAGYIHPMGLLAVPDLARDRAADRRAIISSTQPNSFRQAATKPSRQLPKIWGYACPVCKRKGFLSHGGSPTIRCSPRPLSAAAARARATRPVFRGYRQSASFAAHEMISRYGSTDITLIKSRRGQAPAQ